MTVGSWCRDRERRSARLTPRTGSSCGESYDRCSEAAGVKSTQKYTTCIRDGLVNTKVVGGVDKCEPNVVTLTTRTHGVRAAQSWRRCRPDLLQTDCVSRLLRAHWPDAHEWIQSTWGEPGFSGRVVSCCLIVGHVCLRLQLRRCVSFWSEYERLPANNLSMTERTPSRWQ